jgi:hypothetical protein
MSVGFDRAQYKRRSRSFNMLFLTVGLTPMTGMFVNQ